MQGLIVQSFIDELLSQVDIVEVIDSYVPLKKRGTSYIACCPFHHEKTPSFNVSSTKQFYHCFGCDASGNVIGFIMNYLQQTFPDAVATLAARAGVQVVYEKNSTKPKTDLSLYQLLEKVANYYVSCLKNSGQEAIEYLKSRGLSGKIASLYQIGYALDNWHALDKKFSNHRKELITTGMLIENEKRQVYDRYRQRLMFPIHNRNGKIIGFGGRVLNNAQEPKYLNSPETVLFQKSRELYGLYQVLSTNKNNKNIIIVEGYMDVLALVQYDIPNVVATLGTATTPYHIQILSKYTKELTFCFDGDAAGRKAAWRALESTFSNLDKDITANFVFLPEGQDPDSLVRAEGKEAFLIRVKDAEPMHQFFFNTLIQDVDISLFTGKNRLIIKAKPYLIKMAESPYKQMLINELARITHIDPHRIIQLIADTTGKLLTDNKNNNANRTPMRLAIAILLQHPEIYTECKEQILKISHNINKFRVLTEIISHIANNPKINTASLVEKWRDTPLFDSINELAGFTHNVPQNALCAEFVDIIAFMNKQENENKIQQLIEKSRKLSLTDSDKEELQKLLKNRHNLK